MHCGIQRITFILGSTALPVCTPPLLFSLGIPPANNPPMPGRGPGAPPPSWPPPPPWFWATPRLLWPPPPPEFEFLLLPRIGELRSFVSTFFNFVPFWIDLSRSPLSPPPFEGLNAGPEGLAGPGGGGAGGPGGGGGGMFARKMNHDCLINMGAAVHLVTFELPTVTQKLQLLGTVHYLITENTEI